MNNLNMHITAVHQGKWIRRISMFLVLTTLISYFTVLSAPASAAETGILFNMAKTPCQGAWDVCTFPAATSELYMGNCYYINMSASTAYKFSRIEIYVKTNSDEEYSLLDTYQPRYYFRWYNIQVKLNGEGTLYIKPLITATDGTQYSGEFCYLVQKEKMNTADSNTYAYNGTIFNVVSNLKSRFFFNQNDYSRFVNTKGNRGCTATAMCIAYSIYHNTSLSPNDVKWSRNGTSWEYCTRYEENGFIYYGDTYTQETALQCVYNCIKSGKPMIIGVTGAGSDHVVTAIGLRDGADYYDLTLADILIIDPNGGTVCSLDKYTGVDTGWGLRIPID